MTRVLYFILGIAGIFSAPVDEPIRIDLPVYDKPRSASNVLLAEPIEPENHPGSSTKIKITATGNVKTNKGPLYSISSNNISPEYPAVGSVNHGSFFADPPTKLEGALLETEGFASKVSSVKEDAQNIVAGIFQPKPIVDTIREEEKYGNEGDKFRDAGRAIVGGAESFSNFFNTLIEVPSKILKSITRAASEKLNNFGGKLVGL
ncbi:uncharacterized protein LOC123668957 [Melitaea cinxia]|uniref:uncharacterized protein LOC123668957 n=1 Tax=Melitaea cinxia TaxID=113334 RepID=UPI001E2716FB|nr:uncharacterized protein LOC123668957 [Melitaea cinxia]